MVGAAVPHFVQLKYSKFNNLTPNHMGAILANQYLVLGPLN